MSLLRQTSRVRLAALTILLIVSSGIVPGRADSGSSGWPMWGYDLSNHRYNPDERAITAANVSKLRLEWAFAFPATEIASAQPTVIDDTVYVGSYNGNVYALDVATGAQRWAFFTGITGKTAAIRTAIVEAHDLILFGDQLGRFFAVNKANGTLAWIQQTMETHPLAQITGSPVVYGDRIYVPMASREENASEDPKYPCCTFRGSLITLNVADGSVAWRFYTVGEPKPTGLNAVGTQNSGPSGVGIWSTPAIDPDAGLIYITTGNSYSPPVSPYSDAIVALDLKDGSLRWAQQVTPDDWSNSSCQDATPGANCAGKPGQDFDFGASPTLFTIKTANGPRKLVTAEQKSGTLYTLDALTGELIWKRAVAEPTSFAWGQSYDGKAIYVSDNTFEKNAGVYALDPATGGVLWHSAAMSCIPGPDQTQQQCWSGYMATAITTPGLVWIGSMDGQLHALDSATGKTLWSYNTARKVQTVNGVLGHGGSIGPTNATVANGRVYVMSGYAAWNKRMLMGNVLFVFAIPEMQTF